MFDTGLTKSKLVFFSKMKRKVSQQKNGDLNMFRWPTDCRQNYVDETNNKRDLTTDVDLTRQEHVQQENQEECMYPETA
jgi:hypothetical protein